MSGRYDPDAPEGGAPRGVGYVTKKDVKIVGIVIAILAVCSYPLYIVLREDSYRKTCTTNLKQIAQAISLYSQLHDERMPTAYLPDDEGLPILVNGAPITWASQVAPNMSERASMECPSATDEEHCRIAPIDRKTGIRRLAFGFYSGLEAQPLGFINDPSGTVMLAETSNGGAEGSYNPVPFTSKSGERQKNDGFLIAWDNKPDGNFGFNEDSRRVTRLAFRNAPDGNPGEKTESRHPNGILAIFADGRIGTLQASSSAIDFSYPVIRGRWASTLDLAEKP